MANDDPVEVPLCLLEHEPGRRCIRPKGHPPGPVEGPTDGPTTVARPGAHRIDVRHGEPATVTVQNSRGEWVPAIPLPIYRLLGRTECGECGRRFPNARLYRGHYALEHILGLG